MFILIAQLRERWRLERTVAALVALAVELEDGDAAAPEKEKSDS